MYSAIESRFSEALAKNALFFTPSTEIRKRLGSGVEAVYTLAPALAKKPAPPQDHQTSTKSETEPSPWLPVDQNLLVEKLSNHSVVLNKFAVAKYHFLLITNEFRSQNLPLDEDDWEAAFAVLRKANSESKKRHVGFFNCGPASGASVAHKHIQFLTLPENFTPFPDTTSKPQEVDSLCAVDNRVPFLQYVAPLPPHASTDDVLERYSDLLGKVLTKIAQSNEGAVRPQISYNLVFTEEWLMVTPRQQEQADGISINALATIGLVLAKSESQLDVLETKNLEIVKDAAFPYEDLVVHRPDHTGYTHY